MRKRTLVLFASLFVFLIGILVMPVELSFAKEGTKKQSIVSAKDANQKVMNSLRALYADKVRFRMLSNAGQLALERKLGIKTNASPSGRIVNPTHKTAPAGGLTNTVVNDQSQDTTASDTQSETGMVLGTSNIIVGFNDSGSFASGAHFTGASYSSNGGTSFVDIGHLPDSSEGDAGDPALARDNNTGRVYLATLGFNTFTVLQIFRSDDDGVTWQAPVSCCLQSAFQDKEWIVVDNAAGAGQGNVYIAWRSFGDGIYFVKSTDHGSTWSNPLKVADQGQFNVQGAFVMTGPSHEIYVVYLDNQSQDSNNHIKIVKSTDQGVTFSSAVTVANLMTTSVNGDLGLNPGFRSNSFPHAVVNQANGHIYVAWNDDVPGADTSDIFYSASTDGGATWSAATDVTDIFDSGDNDDWQPTIAITPGGAQAFIGWYDRELDPNNSLIDWFGAVATVGSGVLNFLPQQRISNTSFPPAFGQDPVVNTVYMGDYDTAVADNGFLHTVWGDNRDPDQAHAHQPDVRYAKIPLGPTGTLQGTVTDSSTTNPIQGAKIDVSPNGGTTFTDANGNYSIIVPIGTYDVTASAFGYLPDTVNGVVITDGGTTVQDFALDQAPLSTVTGTVTDGSGHSWPLYARIDIDGYPGSPIFTNPADGTYSVDLPQGSTFTFHVNAVSGGYNEEQRDILPGQNPTEDFALTVDGSCSAPGYTVNSFIVNGGFETGDFTGWNIDGTSNSPFVTGNEHHSGSFSAQAGDASGPEPFGDSSFYQQITVPGGGGALTFWTKKFTTDSITFDWQDAYITDSTGNILTTIFHVCETSGWTQWSVDLGPYAGQTIRIKFLVHQDGFGDDTSMWVDDVIAGPCNPVPGGLMVGNVYDLNTGDGLNGAKVTSDEQPADTATTFSTPADPGVDEGFYILFSSLTGLHDFTATKNQFGSDTESVDVAADAVVVQNFQLGTGHLVATPPAFDVTVDLGTQQTQTMTITNDGNADANFELQEGNGLSFKIRNPGKPIGHGAKLKLIHGTFSPLSALKGGNAPSKKPAGSKRGPNDAPWTDIAGYPSNIMDNAGAEDNGLIYQVGGYDGFQILNTGNVYDPSTDSWSAIANMSGTRERPAVASINGLLYVTNGWDSSGQPNGTLEIYDPSTDSWSSGAANPNPMGGGSDGLNFEDKFYVIGGCDAGSCGFTNVNIYDPATDSWSSAADYPEPISWMACGDVGGAIVCAGGTAGSSTTANAYSYDPGTDSWTPVAPMPQDQWAMGYIASGGKLYVSGGVTSGFSTITNAGFVYDPGADSWSALENSNNTVYRGGSACGFYRVGGSVGGFSPVPNSEVYPDLTDCGGGADVPWLSENPVTALVPAGSSVDVDVTFDAAQVQQPGDYFAHITVRTDTPYPAQKVDVTMHVPFPANFGTLQGTVSGLGQCDTPGGTLAGATVFIDGQLQDFTIQTDANGNYTWALDEANSPITLTVSANGYVQEIRSGVIVVAQQTTTEDFTLRLDAACLSVNPTDLEDTVPFGGQDTQTFTITNDGASDADFSLTESNGLSFGLRHTKLPKAQVGKGNAKGKIGPTSVMTMKNAPKSKLKALFPSKGPNGAGWTPTSNLANSVIRYAHAQCDDSPESYYVISGVDSGFGLASTMQRYDADTDTWTTLAAYPNAAEAPTAVCLEGRIYVANGAFTSNEFFIYDIATDTWLSGATLPRFVEGGAMGALDGKIYLIGGDDDFQPADGISNEVDIYDVATDTWTGTGSPMPEGVSNAGMVQAGQYVYVVGGWNSSSPAVNSTMTQRYDMSADTWEVGPSFDLGSSDFALSATDTALYAAGGDANGGGFFDPSSAVQRLDLSSWPAGSWADLGNPLPEGRLANNAGFCTTAASGGEVWSTGGLNISFVVDGKNQYFTTGEGCAGAIDVPWLSENPFEGTIPKDGGQQVIDVNYDASQILQPGDYFAHITVHGNAPGSSPKVNVTMHVLIPPNFGLLNGTVTGLGQCDVAGGPIAGATIFIDGPNADYTVETDANGYYQWYFDAANSPVNVTVSANGYIGMTQTGVVMNAGQTTTVDFSLRLDAPCLTVDQTSLDQTLPLGGLATQQVTISNSGAGDANYKFHESGGAALKLKHAKPILPKAVSKADMKRLAMSGPTSVRSLKNVHPDKLKGLFPHQNVPQAWIDGAPNPNPVIRYGHAQCDDTPESFYVISGVDSGFGLSSALSRYDADTNTWTSLAPIPSASEAPTAVCFEDKLYVAVGAFTSNEFLVYDIATDSWSSAASLPRFVEGAAMGAVDGKIYLIGGDDDFQPASGVSNEVDIYDIATNSWTGTGTSMPTATANAGYVQSGPFVYVVGGWGVNAPAVNVDQTQRYDMSSDTWEVGPTFDVAVSDFAISGTDTALYAMGGDANGNGFFEPTTTAQRLDLSTWPSGSWADLGDPLPSARQANQAGFCSTSFTGGEVWTTDAYDGGSVNGINQYRATGEGCANGSTDVPWLSENPEEGVVPAGGQVVVDITFDASQVPAEGDYFAQLKISGNAPGASPTIDVALHVAGGACDYAQDFNDATMEWIQEKPAVTQPGDGFLHLDPVKKKAIAVADSSFAGATTAVFNFDVQFGAGTDTRNWIYTHRVDKKNQMEVLFKVEQGKVVVKDRGPGGVEAKAKGTFTLAPNTPYSVSILYNGTAYAVTINGTTVISGFSPVGALPNANIGAAAKNDSMLIDNVCVINQ